MVYPKKKKKNELHREVKYMFIKGNNLYYFNAKETYDNIV